ncbi:MAG: glycerol-3-phosphate acyltransferase, partial [Bdellovibrio sp.]|nr:glycerol-3-phosphate acyltransferase [Bdellovibrio sp.]
TAFGVILFLAPTAAGCGLFGFVLTYFYRRIVSLASLAGLGTAAVSYLVLNPIGVHLWSGAALALLVLIRHEKNIDALLENREKAFQ